jgi:hypothetical protein
VLMMVDWDVDGLNWRLGLVLMLADCGGRKNRLAVGMLQFCISVLLEGYAWVREGVGELESDTLKERRMRIARDLGSWHVVS